MAIRTGLMPLLAMGVVVVPEPVWGQSLIVPDDTLGAERSQVIPDAGTFDGRAADAIQGGARRGQNLFHSFSEFNVDEGRAAVFVTPVGLANIFSRVTGGNASEILGTLGTFGDSTPDLYLINPNGILFGPNASLAVDNSFAAVTAEGIQFGNRGAFNATVPELPSELLTVAPSAFLFGDLPAGSIVNQAVTTGGLAVEPGQTLVLLGGEVVIDGGRLSAAGGRIDVGAVSGAGAVTLAVDGGLVFPQTLEREDVQFVNGAFLTVASDDGGDIAVTARNIDVLNSSILIAGILAGLGDRQSQSGDIVLNASESIQVAQSSGIGNIVSQEATGTGGNIRITTAVLDVLDGARLAASTLGNGDVGDVIITASDRVTFAGTSEDGQSNSAALSRIAADGVGTGGNVDITTPVLEVLDGAQLAASTFGQGDAGNVNITASDRVTFAGTSDDGRLRSSALSRVEEDGVGTGGNIVITTAVLEVLNGGQLAASTLGQGDAGDVNITASDRVTFAGTSDDDDFLSAAFSRVGMGGVGMGGNIDITTAVLEVLDGARLTASTLGQGDAGSVLITASDRVTFAGVSEDGQFSSGALSRVSEGGIGTGGNITITTSVLDVVDGAQLAASTFGQGDAGDIIITASDRVTFAGTSEDGRLRSAALSRVEVDGVGAGGNIIITTPALDIIDGAQIAASTLDKGDAGDIILIATETARLMNGAILSTVAETGDGTRGDITIRAGNLTLSDGSLISTQDDRSSTAANATGRDGAAASVGRLRIVVDGLLTLEDSDITTQANAVAGGEIIIRAGAIRLFGDSDIQTSVQSGSEEGGNITLTADSILAFDDSDIFAFAADGQGGNITLNTPAFFGENFTLASLDADPSTLDGNDRVDINATGAVTGVVTVPDVSFIRNSVADLPEGLLNTESLIANSCIARNEDGSSTFVIVGVEGRRDRPDNATADFPTGDVQTIPEEEWRPGNPIVEPQGVYQLPDGALVLSHACQ